MDVVVASGQAAALWVGLHLFLLLVLSMLVVRLRQKHHVSLGDGAVPELAHAIRAFGNASEYVPAGLVALTVMAVAGAPALAIHVTGLVLLVSRIAHAIGLSRSGEATLPRAVGVAGTWLAYIFAGVALLFFAIR
jgi:uncharacterized protein